MIVIDNNEMTSYGGREIVSQDLHYLVTQLSSGILMTLHQDIIRELKERDNAENNTDN